MSGQLQLTFVSFKKGSYIVVEGKHNADRFFIIREGKVRISKAVEVVVEEGSNLLGPGDFFGVVSTMSTHSHIETAQAITDVTLISVEKDQYSELIQKNSAVAMKIILLFSKRMRYLDEALTRLTLKNAGEEGTEHLFIVAEYYAKISQYNHAYHAYSKYVRFCPQGENFNLARERMMKIAPYVKTQAIESQEGDYIRKYPKDFMIFAEGEPGEELYIIQKGSVKIAKIADNNEVLLAVLKSGDIFGEMALLESKPRTACAVAYEDALLLTVNRENFSRMVVTQPQIVAKLTTLLSERIWFIYKQIANTLIADPLGRLYDVLLIQLEKARVDLKNVQSHIFDFGPKELINMVGLSQAEGNLVMKKIMDNHKIRLINEKICVLDAWEISKQAQYYRNMERIEKHRKAGVKKP
ncbi:Crp/Fnr family transcriptional regulator [Treponema primitia]|uniref:Crp/Fnr family transcriptional regulator n=1 Tax=Treponema primitia TaxID=88058 RepID=UPI0005A2CF38|nr:cyclic nucleotide-binding domain-containing protein [Treponema primitia]